LERARQEEVAAKASLELEERQAKQQEEKLYTKAKLQAEERHKQAEERERQH